jgi:sugar-specific transcriptional regulator TrmB
MEKAVKLLKEFGLNSYEARAYLSLLLHPKITASEISKLSGVPPQRIYDSLKKLEKKGFVYSIGEKPKLYVPLPFKEALTGRIYQLRLEFEKKEKFLKSLIEEVEKYIPKNRIGHEKLKRVLTIEGEENIVSKALELISETEKTLWIAGIKPLFKFGCRGNLDKYLRKTVKLTAVGKFDTPCKEEIKKLGGNYVERDIELPYLLISDGVKVLAVYERELALYTKNRTAVEPFKVYFRELLKS